MFARLVSKIIVGVFFFCSAYAEGSLQERLNAFQTLSADIVETTVSDGIVREMKGTLAIKRPNHFAWRMTAPDAQEIISNGKKIWQYEPDLDQVIVREIDQELQGVPLLLLSGDVTDIDTIFDIKTLNENTFELTPKTDDQVVKMIRLQFKGAYLSTLDIHNTLSQDIHIAFSHVQYNAVIDDAVFEFHIPDGIDVVEQ